MFNQVENLNKTVCARLLLEIQTLPVRAKDDAGPLSGFSGPGGAAGPSAIEVCVNPADLVDTAGNSYRRHGDSARIRSRIMPKA